MKTYIQKGGNLTLAAPYDVTSGHGVKSGLIFGVASGDALSDADGDVARPPPPGWRNLAVPSLKSCPSLAI